MCYYMETEDSTGELEIMLYNHIATMLIFQKMGNIYQARLAWDQPHQPGSKGLMWKTSRFPKTENYRDVKL